MPITRIFSFTGGAVGNLVRLSLKQPGYTVRKLRKELRHWRMVRSLESDPKRSFRFPFTVMLNLTHRCNLRCTMCGQYGHAGIYTQGNLQVQHSMEFDMLRALVDEVAFYADPPDLYLWGGEPLMYPQLKPLLRHLKRRKLLCVINTNGTLLDRFADDIVGSDVDSLNVSVLGPSDVHDEICRVPGSFDRLSRGVRRVVEARRRTGRLRPLMKMISTITPDNYTRLGEIVNIAESLAFDVLVFSYGWFTTEQQGKATDRLYRKLFGCACRSWSGFAVEGHGFDLDRLRAELRAVYEGRPNRLYIKFTPSLFPDQVATYYEKPNRLIGDRRCVSPWMKADVRPNGDVVPCADFPDVVLGNVKQEPFLDIWNGHRMKRFRRELSKRGTFPICSRCCGMFT